MDIVFQSIGITTTILIVVACVVMFVNRIIEGAEKRVGKRLINELEHLREENAVLKQKPDDGSKKG